MYLAFLRRFDESLRSLQLAQQLDPVSIAIVDNLGWTHHFAGQYERAIVQTRKPFDQLHIRASAAPHSGTNTVTSEVCSRPKVDRVDDEHVALPPSDRITAPEPQAASDVFAAPDRNDAAGV